MEQFMKNVSHNLINIDRCMILSDNIGDNLLWYYEVIAHEHPDVRLVGLDNVTDDGKIVVFLSDSKKYIEDHYNAQILQTFNNVTVYKLRGKKYP